MGYQLTPTVPVHAVIFCITLGLGIYAGLQYRRYKAQPELPSFMLFMLGISLAQICALVISTSTSAEIVLWIYNFTNAVVIVIIVYSFFLFTLNFSGYTDLPERYVVAVAVVQSLVLSTAVFVEPNIFYEVTSFEAVGPLTFMNVTVSEWLVPVRSFHLLFLGLQISSSVVVLSGMATVVRYLLGNTNDIDPVQSVVILLALLSPIGTNLLLVFDLLPRVADPLMLSFGVTAIGFAVATFRYRTFDIAPTGRQQVITDMDDAVVLLNSDGVVADMNPAAETLFEVGDSGRGMAAEQIFEEDLRQLNRESSGETLRTRISRTIGGRIRHFDLRVSPVEDQTADEQATLIVFRDITAVIEREQELDLLTQIFSRVLRHNIRNDMSAVTAYADLIARNTDEQNAERAQKVMNVADDLVAVSNKARSVERLVQTDQRPASVDLVTLVEGIVDRHRAEFPNVTFTTDLPEACTVTVIPAVNQAITNLVENAAEHNTNDDPRVRIELTVETDPPVLTISDNGPGIPAQELSVIEQRQEEALKHTSGVGLWVVDWVHRNSTVTIAFDEAEPGTEATVHIGAEQAKGEEVP